MTVPGGFDRVDWWHAGRTAIDIWPNFFQIHLPICSAWSFCTTNQIRLCNPQNEEKHCCSWFRVIASWIQLAEHLVRTELMNPWLQTADVLANVCCCFQFWLCCSSIWHRQLCSVLVQRDLPNLFYCQVQNLLHWQWRCLEFSSFNTVSAIRI